MTTGQLASLQIGQRVWVADGAAGGRRISGVIASLDADFLGSAGGLVVRLDVGKKVVTCHGV